MYFHDIIQIIEPFFPDSSAYKQYHDDDIILILSRYYSDIRNEIST